MPKRVVEFFRHDIDEECIEEFTSVAKDVFITTGPKTAEFENAFASYLGVPHAVGVMSCTHALHLAYLALGIGPGDEVIVPAFTFAATATSVLHAGAKPVFVDVDAKTGILDPDKTEEAITGKTRAICPVHLYGVMAPMDKFKKIADKHGLKLVEDSAHCVEGRGPGFGPGTLSDAAAFSFYATKNITCGEGGALVTRDENIAKEVGSLRTHGMTKNAMERFSVKFAHYDIERLGYKCNLTDLQSALLMPQLRRIEDQLSKRVRIVEAYNEGLNGIKGITLPFIPKGYKSACHLYTIRITPASERDSFLSEMIDEGVKCAVHYRPLARLAFFRKKLGMNLEDFPNSSAIGDSTITLPLYPSMSDAEVDKVIRTAKKVAEKMPLQASRQ